MSTRKVDLLSRIDTSWILIGILVIFHSVGFFGLVFGDQSYFLSLSPLNLCIAFTCLVLALNNWTIQRFWTFLIIGCTAFLLEFIGVQTGYLFGNYWYGANLGWKIGGVPIVIALNWIMLCVGSTSIASKLTTKPFYQALIAAFLMTSLDVIIEPVAIWSDFWHWQNEIVPVYNYVCWFFAAFGLNFFLLKREKINASKVPSALFVILSIFFISCLIAF